MNWADVAKILLGAALSIFGGFWAQLRAESLRVKETDHQLLVKVNVGLTNLYHLLTGNVRGSVSEHAISNSVLDLLRDLHFDAVQLRTKRTQQLAVKLVQLVEQHQVLLAPENVLIALNATQDLLNPRLKKALQKDELSQMIENVKKTGGS